MATAKVSSAVLKHNHDVVVSTYRSLLRATRVAFNGDGHMISESRKWARHNFDQGRTVAPGSVEAEQGIKHAQATAQILRENVVQGQRENAQSHHYKLNIHEETERGDDTEFKKFKSSGKSFADMRK
ncbi:hypothetical protein AAFC00_001391 [Neodothiora populina]|uniref:Mitochondrial zinc maintenance protein 1, mitochondrial n=1 Tax=Neodothiora populina TaxID=2781224 RepID=A0ABR3PNR6_9PEZI